MTAIYLVGDSPVRRVLINLVIRLSLIANLIFWLVGVGCASASSSGQKVVQPPYETLRMVDESQWDDRTKAQALAEKDFFRIGRAGSDPPFLEGVWIRTRNDFPTENRRLRSMFDFLRKNGSIESATTMRRVSNPPERIDDFTYEGFKPDGGGLNGKPTGVLRGYKSKKTGDYFLAQEIDVQITEGYVIGNPRTRNLVVKNRPAHMMLMPQENGAAVLRLVWEHDGFSRQIHYFCEAIKQCNQRDFLLKFAESWD